MIRLPDDRVLVAVVLTLGAIGRDKAREAVITWAMFVWQCRNVTESRRRYLYPLAAWAMLVVAGVRFSQSWAPVLMAVAVGVLSLATRKKAVAA